MKAKTTASKREHTPADVRQAVAEAKKAQVLWRETSFGERKKIIRRMSRIIQIRADEIAETIAACTGKTRFDALSAEVFPSAAAAGYYARSAKRLLKKKRIRAGIWLLSYKRSTLRREPWGVIGIISPWNYPFGIPFHETAMGLMAGNGVVLKVASIAGPVGELIRRVMEEAGVPRGLFQLVNLPGPKAGPAFIEAGVNKLFFTGSIAVGKELMRLASAKLIPVCLELGGNDAMIVRADAPLDRAVNGALWAGLSNCGQACGGVQRIYAHESIVRPFTRLLVERMRLLRQGRENDFDADVGALATRAQYDTVKAQVKKALAQGASIVVSVGTDDPRRLLHPLLLLDHVRTDMNIMQEEIFGPVMAVAGYQQEDEAVARANATVYGLTASVWSKDIRRAKKIAARLEAGAVTINDHLMSHGLAETHWGGYKESGIGRSHGQTGFEEMTQSKVVVNDLLGGLPRNMWWYPHSKKAYDGIKGVIDLLYAKGLGKKLAGLGRMVGLFLGSFRKW